MKLKQRTYNKKYFYYSRNHKAFFFLLLFFCTMANAAEICSQYLTLRHTTDNSIVLTRTGQNLPSLQFKIPNNANVAIKNNTLTINTCNEYSLKITLPHDQAFALVSSTLTNKTDKQINLPVYQLPEATLDLGVAADKIRAFGTAGLTKPNAHPGSYVFLALAEPQSRAGLVAGWTTFERGDGILFSGCDDNSLTFAAQTDYGRLLLEPGQSVKGETLAIGFFDDVRLGLEQWADLTAAVNHIELPNQLSGYCTWYSKKYGGACDEQHIQELAKFASRELTPYGFNYIQIDDNWQDGTKDNGPRKVFEHVDPNGPYPSGMKATAHGIRNKGLVPGIWYMPFAGTHTDPWFADKQNWFVKREDGSVYFNRWGGGSLDVTNPEVQDYIYNLAKRIGRDWGYELFKLDGLWTGLGNQMLYIHNSYKPDDFGRQIVFNPSLTPFQAYHNAFRLIRKGAGNNVFILGCNTAQNMRSFGAAIGMVDAMRIGPDNKPDWSLLKVGPWHGSNRWFLNRRIWYNDPDPIYVRDSMPIEHARLITSWVAVSGTLNASSDWLPELPTERLELIKRSLPVHKFNARPVDVLEHDLAMIWLVSDEKSGRYVLGLFNWDDKESAHIEYDTDRLGLPTDKQWIGREFWSGTILEPFKDKLVADLAPGSCQVLALREVKSYPRILASSRHITQGLTDIFNESWNNKNNTLSADTDVIANDVTHLTISASSYNRPKTVILSKADIAAGATAIIDGVGTNITVTLKSPETRRISWSLLFHQ
ncbi:MAG: TIM-barrel domain-containing protein [Phycisphaerales bacterium]